MHDDILTPRLCLRLLPTEFLEACLHDEFARAETILGLKIPDAWRPTKLLLEVRLHDCREDPKFVPWSLRAMGLRSTGEVVGQIGFHTRPDAPYLREFVPRGVELGYSVLAAHRRQGYATEALRGMMGWAHGRHGVDRFIVSIAPANAPSRTLAARLGFEKIGGHLDEIDGYEDVYLLTGERLHQTLATEVK